MLDKKKTLEIINAYNDLRKSDEFQDRIEYIFGVAAKAEKVYGELEEFIFTDTEIELHWEHTCRGGIDTGIIYVPIELLFGDVVAHYALKLKKEQELRDQKNIADAKRIEDEERAELARLRDKYGD